MLLLTWKSVYKKLQNIMLVNENDILTIEDVLSAFPTPPKNSNKKLILKAYKFAEEAHKNQRRASGMPYIQHCLAAAKVLATLGMDTPTIIGGLLHDVPEDTPITLNEIEKKFGGDIAFMIEGITKLGKMKLKIDAQEAKLENWRRMFLAMGKDIRTVVIKLADRLHNMHTLQHLRPEKQRRIANETMEIFIPIANRLGISKIKTELSELCFMYLKPNEYKKTKELRDKLIRDNEQYIENTIQILKKELKSSHIEILDIQGRIKELYSLYNKLQKYDGNINRVYDVLAFRIIVLDEASCYKVLGEIHKKYKPMIRRIKDYIALPKPNGYKSIHSIIFGPGGKRIEVQIRTQEMHDEAENGIASHWLYKEKNSGGWRQYLSRKKQEEEDKNQVEWARKLREWQKDLDNNPNEFMEGLQVDFLKNHIFAFTPNGDIIELPEGSCIVDFAYAIHTEIGNTITGARSDGVILSLDSTISNGSVIEILTDKNRKGPNIDWLKFVKTSHAKNAIRKYIKNSEQLSK